MEQGTVSRTPPPPLSEGPSPTIGRKLSKNRKRASSAVLPVDIVLLVSPVHENGVLALYGLHLRCIFIFAVGYNYRA